jgi:uncharacterized coiled-coil protein SlyX
MPDPDDVLSIQAASTRLGVSRWRVWQMIADGTLDVEPRHWHGKLVPGVRVNPDQTLDRANSRIAQLQEQVDKLAHTVRFLAALVTELSQERIAAREQAPPVSRSTPLQTPEVIPYGITARPNPMTAPLSALEPVKVPTREEALAEISSLFQPPRKGWWPR